MVEEWICRTCGAQFAASEAPPRGCPICQDQRQYLRPEGTTWTTRSRLQADGFRNTTREYEPGLLGIGTTPQFAIGQRALLVGTAAGNVLWDCISLLDDETAESVAQRGGIAAIAISHPHFYTSMVDWAERFDARIYLHEADRRWVMRPSDRITFWSGETLSPLEGITLLRLGGHFSGSTALHWRDGAAGRGALLTGDTITVVPDRAWVSFMFSYPNLIPLPAAEVRRIATTVARYTFDRLYGGWFDAVVAEDARGAVLRSADRYARALDAPLQ
jgi:glyoxylase-like metal-dependent hydrolase (beta-lactamase superfamily II)